MKFFRKFLIKLLVIVFVLVGIFIVIPLVVFHKSVTQPLSDYNETHETMFYQSLDDHLQALIQDDNHDTIEVLVFESFLNRAIQKELSKDNPKFMNPLNEDDVEYRYMMMFSDRVGLKGVWTKMGDNALLVTVGIDVLVTQSVKYQTAMQIDLDIVLNESNQYVLKIDKIKVGKLGLPLKLGANVTSYILDKLQGKSLDEFVLDALPFGQFDSKELAYTVGESELTDYLYKIDPSFSALLKIIYEEALLYMDFSDDGFEISLNMGKFRRLFTDYDEVVFTKLENDADKAVLMADIASNAAMNAALNPFDPRIELDEVKLNQILDYQLQDKVAFEYPFKFKLNLNGVLKEYRFKSSVLFIKMVGSELSLHLKMMLSEKDGVEAFEMQFNLTTTVGMNVDGDMVLTILSSNIGEINLEIETLKSMIDIFDSSLMENDTLVIPKEKLNEMFQGANLSFNDAYVSSNSLYLHFGIE